MNVPFVLATILALGVIGTSLEQGNEKKQSAKADKNLIVIGCVEEGPQKNTFLLTTVSSDEAAGGQRVHLIGGDKGMLADQVGQKVQVSGQVDGKGPGLEETVAERSAVAAPVAGGGPRVAAPGAAGGGAGDAVVGGTDTKQR